jgi:hypothetical protein
MPRRNTLPKRDRPDWKARFGYSPKSTRTAIQGTSKVRRGLGMGLDDKAIECVRQWKFKPAYKDGQPAKNNAVVEVEFRLASP